MIDPTGGPGQAGQSDPTVVYDGGVARPIQTVAVNVALNATGSTAVAAAAGLKTKIIGINAYTSTFTAEGSLSIRDGAGGTIIFFIGRFIANGVRADFSIGGLQLCAGSVNTLVEVFFSGNAFIQYSLVYYQAP